MIPSITQSSAITDSIVLGYLINLPGMLGIAWSTFPNVISYTTPTWRSLTASDPQVGNYPPA